MKKLIAIGLIFVMSGQCLFRLGVVAYFQLNRDYIAKELCINKDNPITMCYGQCFLNKNLNLADNTEKTPVSSQKDKVEIPFFLVSETRHTFTPGYFTIRRSTAYVKTYVDSFHSAIFHPPTLLS